MTMSSTVTWIVYTLVAVVVGVVALRYGDKPKK